ncbi:MAG: flagellar protein FlaG [Deltaproteobacteria bacterium]|nr:flagellar protein FlaG [Deltaproteobacteria bacterium]
MQINSVDVSQSVLVAPVTETSSCKREGHNKSQPADETAPNKSQVAQMVKDMQDYIKKMNISLEYSTYGKRGEKIAVTVADKETGEVIREIPPKEIRDLYVKMSEVAGMIFNKEI